MNRRRIIMSLPRIGFSAFHFRRALLLIAILIVLVYAIFYHSSETELTDRAAQLKEIAKSIHSVNVHSQLWQGRQACRHPTFDINNPEIMKFVKNEPIECKGEKDWVEIEGNRAYITQEARRKHGDIECACTDLLRTNDFATQVGLTTKTHTEYSLETSDFVRVDCYGESGERWTNIMAGARYDQDIFDRAGWDAVPEDAMKLNVLMFGFDSISRLTFKRKLPKSLEYLEKELGTIILKGYNIIGDGTPQALIPILTGKTELELPDTRRRMGHKATYVNAYPFIWNNYKDAGYVTGFMEDTPSVGIFTYRLKGFNEVPTDFYMRPFYVDAENNYFSHFSKYCLGSMPRHKVMLEYMKHMFRVYKEKPKFAFGFHGEISHDGYNLIGAADEDLRDWLEWFKKSGHLNNTVLILMSDHGHRFAAIRNTQQGKVEERLPFFSFTFPPWFGKKYPQALENMKTNVNRLTTPFDIHETLASILKPQGFGVGDIASHRGISLFQEVPRSRTCTDAFIEPHWCACLDWESVDENDPIVQRAARAYVKFMNKYNAENTDECAESVLKQVTWSARLVPSGAFRKFHSSQDRDGFVPNLSADTPVTSVMYQLKLITDPGNALFEMSLTHDISLDEFKFRIEDVSRINEYGPQARCVEHTLEHLRKFCYCRDGH